METYKFKDIGFIISADKSKIVPFVKSNENKVIKLILENGKLLRNTKMAIRSYVGGDYKVVESYTMAGLVAKNQIKIIYDYNKIAHKFNDILLIDQIKKKRVDIYKSEVDVETLQKYVDDLKTYFEKKQAKEQEAKTM